MLNDNFSDVTIELIKKLRKIHNNNEFIFAILICADNDEDRQTIIDFINAGEDVDMETVSVLAMDLSDARQE